MGLCVSLASHNASPVFVSMTMVPQVSSLYGPNDGFSLVASCGPNHRLGTSSREIGVCPSCNGRHMAQTATHLVDHVIPPVPVRQWVISVPKRLRGMLADRPRAVAALTKIFLDEIERFLCAAAGGPSHADTPSASRPRLGGISFLHRFGSALNHHVHLHACVTVGEG
jgi:hypothetical protein